jgi:hypothetical protein
VLIAVAYAPPTSSATRTVAAAGSSLVGRSNYTCDGTADDVEINAAITAASAAGGGKVLLSEGTFTLAAAVQMRSKVDLVGQGWGSILSAVASLNGNMVTLQNTSAGEFFIRSLAIDGNKASQASGGGINFDWSGGSFTYGGATCGLEQVFVRKTKGDAITLKRTDGGNNWYANSVFVHSPDGIGFNLQASDGQWANCASEKTGLQGWQIGGTGACNHLTNCIAADAGQITASVGTGFKLSSGRIQLTGCFSQHNSLHGIWVLNNDTTLVGCHADSNSYANGSANASGFYVETSTLRTIMSGCHSYDTAAGGSRTQAYGYYLNGTCDNVLIGNSVAYNNVTAPILDNTSGTTVDYTTLRSW